MSISLYQLGGYRPQLQWHQHTYVDRQLAEEVAGPGSPLRRNGPHAPIELILGIRQSGSAHLLLTDVEVSQICRNNRGLPRPRARPFLSTEFESLSPIYVTVDELTNLLDKLRPKKQSVDFDTSSVNKGFRDPNGNAGVLRGAFEHGRVFYKVLHQSIQLQKYGLSDSSWRRSIRVCSLVFNIPHIKFDGRYSQDRRRNPKVLDIAFAEATLPSLDLDPSTTKHFIKSENKMLNKNKGSFKIPFAHGTTDTIGEHEISTRFQNIFRSYQDRPMVLLVYEEETTKTVLQNLGVSTETFRTDLKHLLGFETIKKMEEDQKPHISPSRTQDPRGYTSVKKEERNETTMKMEEDRKPHISPSRTRDPRSHASVKEERDEKDPRSHAFVKKEEREFSVPSSSSSRNQDPRRRSRSRSPRRNPTHSPDVKPYASRDDYHRPQHPIYIIDVKEIHARISGESHDPYDISAPEMSLMKLAKQYNVSNSEGWCAGNEAGYIFDIWRSIITGPPIDEQIEKHLAATTSVPQPSSSQQSPPKPALDPDDEDYDPNDLPANPQQAPPPPAAAFDDDESDYGEGFDPDADDDDDDD